MMKKTIEPSNFDASPELIKNIDQLFDDLDVYNDQIVSSDIYLEANLAHDDPNKYVVKVKTFLPGPEIFVEESDDELMKAAHAAYDTMKRALSSRKDQVKDRYEPRIDKFQV